MAGMFGGLLAYGLLKTTIFTQRWKSIFLIEGIVTVGSGLLAFFVIPDSPATCRFLNEEQKRLAEERIKRENAGVKVMIEATKAKLVLRAFKNVNVSGHQMDLRAMKSDVRVAMKSDRTK